MLKKFGGFRFGKGFGDVPSVGIVFLRECSVVDTGFALGGVCFDLEDYVGGCIVVVVVERLWGCGVEGAYE